MGIDFSSPQTQSLISLIVSVATAIGAVYTVIKNSRKTEADTESSLSETALSLLAPYKSEVEGLRKDLDECKKAMEKRVEEAIAEAVSTVEAKYKKQINSLKARIRELENA